MMLYRFIAGGVLLVAVMVAPWWIVCSVILVGLVAFAHYYEAVVAGLAMDGLYSASDAGARTFFFLAVCAVLLVVVEIAKTRMRVFDKP